MSRFQRSVGGALVFGVLLTVGGSTRAVAQDDTPRLANPPGWVDVRTLGYRMALPGDYREFYTFKKDPKKNPHLGNWGFSSPHATRKIFVRVSVLKSGDAAELLRKSEHHLKRKVGGLKKLVQREIPADELGREGVIGFYTGVLHAKSHRTGKLGEYPHVILRCILRYPAFGAQLSVTHMVRGDRADAADEFFLKHIETFVMRDPAEAKRLAAPLLKKRALKVTGPVPSR